jgi:hypothetical protein
MAASVCAKADAGVPCSRSSAALRAYALLCGCERVDRTLVVVTEQM